MSSSRMSIWSVLPPRDTECDLFAPEIANWMSVVLDKDISSDLLAELASGELLCELFIKLCPEIKLGRYHKNTTADVWKRDNIQIFANATVKFGVPRSSMLNYSFFETKDTAMLITSLLVFVKVLIEKKPAEEIKLPESFIQSICSAYLETRILHKKYIEPQSEPAPATSTPTERDEIADSSDLRLSKEEIQLLDEMMKNQVNDMLNDIVNERRKTLGIWEGAAGDGQYSPLDYVEEESDDSFDERYVQQTASQRTSQVFSENRESKQSEIELEQAALESESDLEPEPQQVYQPEPEQVYQSEPQQVYQSEPEIQPSQQGAISDSESEPEPQAETKQPPLPLHLPAQPVYEYDFSKPVQKKEEPKKKSGFWWKTTLMAAALTAAIVAKQYHK